MTRDTDERGKLDIIDELRQTCGHLINGTIEDGEVSSNMLAEAADEIERLRAPAGHAEREALKLPTRSDIGVLIRDSMGKQEGWLQYLPAADAILNYWDILNKAALSNAPAPSEGVREETEIELLAYKLAGAELNYRDTYEQCGGDSINTGRMWDKMKRAGDAIRAYEPATPADTEDQGPDTLGYAKGET